MASTNAAPRDFGFGEDETMLRDLARRFLDERMPVETLRRLVAEAPEPIYDEGQRANWDAGLWEEIVGLGWSGLAVGAAVGVVPAFALVAESGRRPSGAAS